ncbi:MAG: MBL fold metallo-hydrolase [Candidatus Hodarchaeales archaeon]
MFSLDTTKIIQINEFVWTFAPFEGSSRTSFINLSDQLIMVDSGMDPDQTRELRSFAETTTTNYFSTLVLTHYHGDHTWGTSVFEDCDIISTKGTYKVLKEAVKGRYSDKNIILPTKTFEGEYLIKKDMKTVKIVEVNGHTEGSAYLFLPEEKLLFTGDILFAQMLPYGGDPTVNPHLWIKALQAMIELHPQIVIPGHGPVTTVDELIIHKTFLTEYVQIMEQLLEEGNTLDQIKKSQALPKLLYEEDTEWERLMKEEFYKKLKNTLKKETHL